MVSWRQSWWVYSAALFFAWGIVLLLAKLMNGGSNFESLALVGLGYFLGWLSATIKHFLLARNA
jgi:hypothetical protein